MFSKNSGDEESVINLYKQLVDESLKNNDVSSYEYISINIDSLVNPKNEKLLSDNAKSEIIEYCKKYNKTVNKHTKSELAQKDTKNTVYITIELSQKAGDKIDITVAKLENGNDNGGIRMTFTYSDKKWVQQGTATVWSH